MVRVCAWCHLFLGLKRPLQRWTVTHGICLACRERFPVGPAARPTTVAAMLVISQDPLEMQAASELIGRAGFPMVVLADRRRADRRQKDCPVAVERRRGPRRAAPPASWARGYVLVESTLEQDLAALALG